MKRQVFAAIAVALLQTAAGVVKNHIIIFGDFSQNTPVITIPAGDTITWFNAGTGGHWPIPDPNHPANAFDPLNTAPYNDASQMALQVGVGKHRTSLAVPYVVPGTYFWYDFFNELQTAFAGEIIITGCESVCADPHFYGLDGVHYDFQGRPDKTFAMISDPSVEVNTHFIGSLHGTTSLGETCVRTCDHTMSVNPQQTVYVDGKEIKAGQNFNSSTLVVRHLTPEYVDVEVVGRWSMRFHMFSEYDLGAHINIDYTRPHYKYDGHTHGVLGHTLSGKPVPKEKCNIQTEGSCEVEGDFDEYEVKGDLCSTSWKYSQFKC